MYKSIPDKLTNEELTSVVHYAIKILNKYKSADNKDVKFDKIPFRDFTKELEVVSKNLLNEIDVESLRENDVELDKHINNLFSLLTDRLKIQSERLKQMGSDLLKQFSNNI